MHSSGFEPDLPACINEMHWQAGFRLQASGFRLQASGFRLQVSGFRLQASGMGLIYM
jgi:hypothetical protein